MTIDVTTLPSGLTVVSDRMTTVETVSLGVWVDAGTRHEPAELNGIAHLLEHMAFKGTERRGARDIAEEIEAVGGHLNAYTSREHTAYYAKVLKEDTGLAVDILADILQNSNFAEDELERERTVILQEIGQANDTPDDIIFDHFQERAFPDQPLGRPVLGRSGVIESVRREDLLAYMRRHYTADRMLLVAAGHVDHQQLVEAAARHFTGLASGGPNLIEPARYLGGEYRDGRVLEQVHLVLGFAGVPHDSPDFYAASVLSTVLGGGMSSRLFQEIREKRGLVYSIYAFTQSYRDAGLFGIYAGTGESEVAELLPVLCDEIAKVGEALGEDELRRARAQLKAQVLMSLESTASRCEQLAHHMMIFGRPLPVAEIVAEIDAVDAVAVRRVSQRLFAAPPTLAALGPIDRIESLDRISRRLAA